MAVVAVESCTVDQLLQAVSHRKKPGPASLKQIQAALPRHLRRCDDALAEAIGTGKLWKYGALRGAPQYWIESPFDYAWHVVEEKLRHKNGGATEKDLIKWLESAVLKGVIEPPQVIQQFVEAQQLFAQPKKGRAATKYTRQPFEFVDKLVDELFVTVRKLAQQAGFSPDQAIERAHTVFQQRDTIDRFGAIQIGQTSESPAVGPSLSITERLNAPQDAAIRDQLLQAMREINPRVDENDLVQIPELRQRLDFQQIDKSTFDRVLLEMYYSRQVILFKIGAGQFSEAERHAYVSDDEGHFYNAVSLWNAL